MDFNQKMQEHFDKHERIWYVITALVIVLVIAMLVYAI